MDQTEKSGLNFGSDLEHILDILPCL